jgi:serine/threonine-protein kinase
VLRCRSCQAENEDDAETCFTCAAPLASGGPIAPGTIVAGRYEILDCLGRGGMGTVYKAHDRTLDETIALKTLRSDVAREPEIARRFRSEIKLARRVRHENVCAIHEYGEDGPLRFIAMELIDGVDLNSVLAEAPLPPTSAFDVALQVAHGLQAIHEAGIIHRDLKTSNLMRDSKGVVRLMDFGIAKKSGSELTLGGQLLGTPEYMSPEQARGLKLDFRSDVYALGVVVYEVFTGRVPLQGNSPIETILKQLNEEPALDGPDARALPPQLVPVLRRALDKDPARRYASAREAGNALADAQREWQAQFEADVLSAVAGDGSRPAAARAIAASPTLRAPGAATLAGLRSAASSQDATLVDARAEPPAEAPTAVLPRRRSPSPPVVVPSRRGPWLAAVSAFAVVAAAALLWALVWRAPPASAPRRDAGAAPTAAAPPPAPPVGDAHAPAEPAPASAGASSAGASSGLASQPPAKRKLLPTDSAAAPATSPRRGPPPALAATQAASPVTTPAAQAASPVEDAPEAAPPPTSAPAPTPPARPAPMLLPPGVPPPAPHPRNRLPEYPKEMIASGAAGTVYLKILVTSEGEVKEASVVSGDEPFAAAALAAARGWRFTPPTLDGEPRDVYMIVPIPFRPPKK